MRADRRLKLSYGNCNNVTLLPAHVLCSFCCSHIHAHDTHILAHFHGPSSLCWKSPGLQVGAFPRGADTGNGSEIKGSPSMGLPRPSACSRELAARGGAGAISGSYTHAARCSDRGTDFPTRTSGPHSRPGPKWTCRRPAVACVEPVLVSGADGLWAVHTWRWSHDY